MVPSAGSSPARPWLRRLPGYLVLIAAVLLVLRTGIYLVRAGAALRYPYQLDYGEGIVWQQLRLIGQGHGYGPIDGVPAIVFHYPPLYHQVTAWLATLTGGDELQTGRTLSLACTLIAAALIARLAALLAPREAEPRAVWTGAVLAGLIALNMLPTALWSVLLRVDMLCMALTFAGLLCGMLAVTRPRLIYGAAVLFVAAIYTKQTAIAAPAAVFGILLLVRPRTAFAGIGATLGLGLVLLAALSVATEGGFLTHIVLYNINRLDLTPLEAIRRNVGWHFAFVLAGLAGARGEIDRLRARRAGSGAGTWRQHLASHPGDARAVIALLHLGLATLMLGMLAKSGASDNYLIEWDCLLALFSGLIVRDACTWAFAARRPGEAALWHVLPIPAALVLQGIMHPLPDIRSTETLHRKGIAAAALVARIRSAPAPVISDDMVAVLRAGKPVLIEPAIVTELAAKGVWDERPFVAQIRAHRFAFFVTDGLPGTPLYDSRHSPAVAAALREAYPVRVRAGAHYLHFPAAPLPGYKPS